MGVLLRDFMVTMTDSAKSDQPTGDQRLVMEAEERCNGYLRPWLELPEFRAALRKRPDR